MVEFVLAATRALRAFDAAKRSALRKARLGMVRDNHRLTQDQVDNLGRARALFTAAFDCVTSSDLAARMVDMAHGLIEEADLVIPARLRDSLSYRVAASHLHAEYVGR